MSWLEDTLKSAEEWFVNILNDIAADIRIPCEICGGAITNFNNNNDTIKKYGTWHLCSNCRKQFTRLNKNRRSYEEIMFLLKQKRGHA